jgi:16S rRNA (guanine1207-N2)-methyltransferase
VGSPGHYFDPSPDTPSRPARVPLDLPDRSFSLLADRGVFSMGRVDAGTRYLLTSAPPPPPRGDLLDLGCGYGPIAVALAARAPGATVWAVDVNERALALTRRNADEAGLGNVRVSHPDDVPDEVRFAGLWSNPPIRIGKAALHDLLSRWLGRLADGGRGLLVVQRNLGADSLQRWLAGQGWAVERLGSRAGSRLLDVRAGAAAP